MSDIRGIVIIAVGNSNYVTLAENLALSIRACISNIPICLIHDGEVLTGMRPECLGLFTNKIRLPDNNSITPSQRAFTLKTQLYDLSPYQQTLYIDADCIMVPGKHIEALIESLQEYDFTSVCMGYFDADTMTSSRPNYPMWIDEATLENLKPSLATAKIPLVNSSMIWFKKNEATRELFATVRRLYDSPSINASLYRGSKPDEAAFNIACAIHNMLPHAIPYKPIYFWFDSPPIEWTHLVSGYWMLSVISDNTPPEYVLSLYNQSVEYASKRIGIKRISHYLDKNTKYARMIHGTWHISCMGNYKDVVSEQYNLMKSEGLLDVSTAIHVNINGNKEQASKVAAWLRQKSDKFNIIGIHDINAYEFPAITHIYNMATTSQPYYGFYIHTKGVSQPTDQLRSRWRQMLNHYIIRLWQTNLHKVMQGYDLSGCNLKEATSYFPMHYSGNFFWYDSLYVRRLNNPLKINNLDRYNAEFWICSAHPLAYSLADHIVHTKGTTHIQWFPECKIGIFIFSRNGASAAIRMYERGEFQEAHYCVSSYNLPFCMYIADNVLKMMQLYETAHSNAYIIELHESNNIPPLRQCIDILHNGYDIIAVGGNIIRRAGVKKSGYTFTMDNVLTDDVDNIPCISIGT